MSSKLGVGVIGCGAIGRTCHLRGYEALPDEVQILAVADVNEVRAKEAAERFDVPAVYTDYHHLLSREDIDAVSIATPNYLHAQQAIDALRAGKHVLCEKPMALDLESAQAMIEAATENDRQLMVGFTHRFHNFIRRAKELLESGTIGRPFMMRIRFAHEGPYTSWTAMSDWFFDPAKAGGGALLDMGIHAIDLFRYLLGDPLSISAQVATLVKDIAVEDNAIGVMTFPGQCMGYFEVGWTSKEGFLGVEVYGTEGSMIIDYVTPIRLFTSEGGWQEITDCLGGGWPAEVAYFVHCLREGKEVWPTGKDGLAALKIALAAYESSKGGRVISLD